MKTLNLLLPILKSIGYVDISNFVKEVESYLIKYGHCIKKGSFVLLGQGMMNLNLNCYVFLVNLVISYE